MPFPGAYDLSVPYEDPDIHICWVPILDKITWMQYSMAGYKPLEPERIKRCFGNDLAKTITDEHGYARYNELVCCYISADLWARYQYENAKADAERRSLPHEKFQEMVDNLGPAVKAFAMSIDEYNDRKEFETRDSANRISLAGTDMEKIIEAAVSAAQKAARIESEAKIRELEAKLASSGGEEKASNENQTTTSTTESTEQQAPVIVEQSTLTGIATQPASTTAPVIPVVKKS